MDFIPLARKYRPQNLTEFVGQDVMVQTIANSIKMERMPNAILFTGIRGVGKTSAARVIARILNCSNREGINPCGVCVQCLSILQDRHPDVIEMDAASHTSVDDIREILEGLHYKPTYGKEKIYIIDEVHMLSQSAFNALLKTLEEPPEHVRFIFATTEVQKIPLTIVSRCQKFDLKRVSPKIIAKHLANILDKEKFKYEDQALMLIASLADGSVRDAITLCDQAISFLKSNSSGDIKYDDLHNLYGIPNEAITIELLELLLSGNVKDSIKLLRQYYKDGYNIISLGENMLSTVHKLSLLCTGNVDDEEHLSEDMLKKYKFIAAKLNIPILTRCWQILLKGQQEIKTSTNHLMAMEIIFIRLAHVSHLPTLDTITPSSTSEKTSHSHHVLPNSFAEMVDLFRKHKEMLIHQSLVRYARLIKYETGHIILENAQSLTKDLVTKMINLLTSWTGRKWIVELSDDKGEASLYEKEQQKKQEKLETLKASEPVKKLLNIFPEAVIETVE